MPLYQGTYFVNLSQDPYAFYGKREMVTEKEITDTFADVKQKLQFKHDLYSVLPYYNSWTGKAEGFHVMICVRIEDKEDDYTNRDRFKDDFYICMRHVASLLRLSISALNCNVFWSKIET